MGTLLHLQELHTRSYRRRSRETGEEGDDKRKNGQTTPEVDGPVIQHISERGREPREQVGQEYRNTPLGQSWLRIYRYIIYTRNTRILIFYVLFCTVLSVVLFLIFCISKSQDSLSNLLLHFITRLSQMAFSTTDSPHVVSDYRYTN